MPPKSNTPFESIREQSANVIAFPKRPVTRADRRRVASELRDHIANWVNEGGAGDDVKR